LLASLRYSPESRPSGVAEPSNVDEAINSCLKQALALLDIRLLDHL
jgi:DNA repair protein RadC